MSRNLSRTNCCFCSGRIVLEERARHITKDECGIYWDKYEGLYVSNAHCFECEAKYLAWVEERTTSYGLGSRYQASVIREFGFFDLSFRSTFNDEPGEDDLPKFKIEIVITRSRQPWPTCVRCKKRVYMLYGCQCVSESVSQCVNERKKDVREMHGENED
jgi:hypothetical protein